MGLYYLLPAQFLSAFVDNMILFVAQAIIMRDAYPGWYLQLVQATFLFSYIVLSPWVGRLADRYAKRWVLVLGNVVKAAGIFLLVAEFDPALSYAVVGVGAVIYSPAKYGILPYLCRNDRQLLHANAQVEGFTILAILSGAVVGGLLADYSVAVALAACLILYGISALLCLGIPRDPGNPAIMFSQAWTGFVQDCRTVFTHTEGRFALIGTSGFWMASAVLRLAVFIWLPLQFGIHDNAKIGLMISLSGLGLIGGAILTPRLVPAEKISRTILFGFFMALALSILPWITNLPLALTVQTVCGGFGGIFIIPLNALLQRLGEHTIGAGKVVAIQNFAENSLMFIGVLLFLAASWLHIPVVWSMTANGIILMGIVAVSAKMMKKN